MSEMIRAYVGRANVAHLVPVTGGTLVPSLCRTLKRFRATSTPARWANVEGWHEDARAERLRLCIRCHREYVTGAGG